MSFAPPQVTPPQMPPDIPQPEGGVMEMLRTAVALPGKLLNWLRDKIVSLSFAACVGWFVFLALIAMVVVFWFALKHDGDVPWQQTLTIERVVVGILVLLIPIVTYKAVLNWTEAVTSEFPDIQDAWNRGLEALREQNLSLDAIPLFLIVGAVDLRKERSLMAAANLQFIVEAAPAGPAPIHFYASADAIYLILSDASYLSAVSRLVEKQTPVEVDLAATATSTPRAKNPVHFARTIDPSTFQGRPEAGPAPTMDQFSKQTLDVSTFLSHRERAEELRQQPVPQTAGGPTLKPGALTRATEARDVRLSAQEASDQTNRIRYVSQLIKTARYPFCPINGIMVLIPFSVLSLTEDAVSEIQRAVKFDLTSLRETLMLKAPTLALFTGLEQEPGFRELVRRVGSVGAARQRFGQGMDVRCRPTAQELDALAAHACGAFEDWVYTLFREDGALTRPGNTLLHSLLCTVRSKLKTPITTLLSNGFGSTNSNPDYEMPFAGCYFAATGDSEDQRAFVRGVFDKLADVQEDLEWTSQATQNSHRAVVSRYAAIACCVVLSLSLVAMIVSSLS